MPVAWTRSYGRGRMYCSSLGHVRKDFDAPEVRVLTLRSMLFAARRGDPAPG